MGKNTVKKIGNERSNMNLTAGMAARNNIGNEKQTKQSNNHRPHLSYRRNLAAHKSTPAKKLSALERFNRFKALRDKNLKRQVKKILPGGKVKAVKTPKRIRKNMATEPIVNGSHDETQKEQNETDVMASIKLKTPVVELSKDLPLASVADNTNGVTNDSGLVESNKEASNGIDGESETELDAEKSSRLRQVRKSKTNENANKTKEKAKQKRDSKSVTPTRRLSKRIQKQEEEKNVDLPLLENSGGSANVSVEEFNGTKENDEMPTDMSLNSEHESIPFENDIYAAQLKEPYEIEEEDAAEVENNETSMDTNEPNISVYDKSGNVTEENDTAVGSSHDFSLNYTEEEEEREESVDNVGSSRVFSLIRRSLRRETRSPQKKETPEPCTSDVHQYDLSSKVKIPRHNIYSGIRGRKPLRPTSVYNSYYKTKGSESTSRYSLKRKASEQDSYFDSAEKKRFAGDIGNTTLSEKSPGWKFFSSPFNRFWSPKEEKADSPCVKSSTPYVKTQTSCTVNESMFVNYDEETITKSSVSTTHIDTETSKQGKSPPSSPTNKYCVIM